MLPGHPWWHALLGQLQPSHQQELAHDDGPEYCALQVHALEALLTERAACRGEYDRTAARTRSDSHRDLPTSQGVFWKASFPAPGPPGLKEEPKEDYSGWGLLDRLELLAFDARLAGVPQALLEAPPPALFSRLLGALRPTAREQGAVTWRDSVGVLVRTPFE